MSGRKLLDPTAYYNHTIPEHLEDLNLDDSVIVKYVVKCGSLVVAVLIALSIRRRDGVYTYSNEPSVFLEGNPSLTDLQLPTEGGLTPLS